MYVTRVPLSIFQTSENEILSMISLRSTLTDTTVGVWRGRHPTLFVQNSQ
jgi:hypothetical protein